MLILLLLLFAALGAAYLGLVWLCARLSRDRTRRRRTMAGARFALATAVAVLWVGVPLSRDARGPVLLVFIPAVLVLMPAVPPRLPRSAGWALLAAAALLFVGPVARVELLTLRHGGELRRFYEPPTDEHNGSLLFAVFDYSPDRATVLHVQGEPGSTAGYFVEFQATGGGWTWRESQAWLWSDPGFMHSRCPYPVSALLLLHGVGAIDC